MNKKYLILTSLSLLFLYGCIDKRNKENHVITWDAGNGLYIEQYIVYQGGVYAGELRSYWLTDSIGFDKYLFVIEDKETIKYETIGNNLIIQKISRRTKNKGEVLYEYIRDLN